MARRFERLLSQHLKYPSLGTRWSDKFLTELETGLDGMESAQDDLASTQDDLADALLAIKIGLSYCSGLTISAADVGANATITISGHTRRYGDGSTLAITGDTITNRNFSTEYHIYYNDTTCSDTTPNFLSTTDPNNAVPNKTAGRHYVGSVTTPANGAAGTSGTPPTPPGYSGIGSIP